MVSFNVLYPIYSSVMVYHTDSFPETSSSVVIEWFFPLQTSIVFELKTGKVQNKPRVSLEVQNNQETSVSRQIHQ